MVSLSKKATVVYCFVLLPLLLATFIRGLIETNSILVGWSLLLFVVFSSLIKKNVVSEIEIVNNLLANDLLTKEYVEFYEYASKTKIKKLAPAIKSSLLQGYIAEGSFEKAKILYSESKELISTTNNSEIKVNLMVSITNYLLHTGQFSEAYQSLVALEEYSKLLPENHIIRNEIFNNLRIKYLCATNQLSNLEEFNYYFEKATQMSTKIQLKFFLGNYYELNNDISSAIEEYKYVADNGKNLYVAQIAKIKINSLKNYQSE